MTDSLDYEDVLQRIAGVYQSCSLMEQKLMKRILQEIQDKGYSRTLEQLYLVDFKEVPVSINEFISSPFYMGPVTRNGDAIYPFWKETLSNIFNAGNKYNQIILSGATRIGKTSTAVVILAYILYRLMLYRNPHEYFKKKEVSKFTIGFANLTKDLAAGVAYREFNDTLKECPWFMEHGRVSKSDQNFYYIPEGDKITIVPASDAAHMLGMQIWGCLIGSTEILQSDGTYISMEDAEDKYIDVVQYADDGSYAVDTALVKCTKYVNETIRIYIDNNQYIEGTPDHRILLSNGDYKMMKDITMEDDIAEVNICHI